MDARELLRRYLEQRRDLGEQELVLDGMDVDEVLRIVGALRGRAPASGASSPPPDPAQRPATPERPPTGERETLHRDDHPAGRTDEHASQPSSGADFDWRAALRAAGGAPTSPEQRPLPPRDERQPPMASAEGERGASSGQSDASGTRAAGADAGPDEGDDMPPRKTRKAAPQGADARGSAAEAAELPSWLRGIDVPLGLAVGGRTTELADDAFTGLRDLDEVARAVHECTRCPLYRTATHGVPGEGNPDADLVCVGEAPGAQEDETGRPFVGASGQLLTKILEAIKLSREEVFICNVLKHRPPGNRNPAPDEVEACSPYLLRQLELLKPKVIVTFGTFAAQTLLRTKTPIGKLREQVHLYHGIPLVVTYHPAALLRNPAWKRPTWNDVQLARRILDRAAGA